MFVLPVIILFMSLKTREMDFQSSERLNSIKNSMTFFNERFEFIRKKMETLEEENRGLKLENNVLKSQLSSVTNKLRDLEVHIDENEQYLQRDCLENKGIPVQEDEDTNDLVVQVANLVGAAIQVEDISISHRLPSRNDQWKGPPSTPVIIAKFVRREVKEEFYKACFKLKNKTMQNMEGSDLDNHIYVSESLTQARKKLFKSCLKIKKELKLAIAATSNGKNIS